MSFHPEAGICVGLVAVRPRAMRSVPLDGSPPNRRAPPLFPRRRTRMAAQQSHSPSARAGHLFHAAGRSALDRRPRTAIVPEHARRDPMTADPVLAGRPRMGI